MSKRGSPPPERRPKRPTRRLSPKPFADAGRAPGQRSRRFLAWGSSVAAHVAAFTALFWLNTPPPPTKPSPILVSLVTLPKQTPAPPGPTGPPGPADAAAKATSTPKAVAVLPAPRPAPAPVPVQVAARAPTPDADTPAPDDMSDLLNDSQLAGAASAGGEGGGDGSSGGGGGGCDTARAVQRALRRDPLVHTAVEDAHRLGKSVMLWNGDWVRSGAQDGKGLSAVREAIIWEVAFAPEACRNARVHGLVVLSLGDGNTRFAIGAGDWRWSDLLTAH
jgi:hypothetical protein